MLKAKHDFLWYKKGDSVDERDFREHPNWAEHVEGVTEEPVKEPVQDKKGLNFDVNKDGKFDFKDVKAMAKKLGSRGGRPKKFKKN